MKTRRIGGALLCALWLAGCPTTPPVVEQDQSVDGGADGGGQSWPDGGADVGDARPDEGISVCWEADIALWRDLHQDPWLVSVIYGCVTGAACEEGPTCELGACLRRHAGMDACDACVNEEVACVSNACADDCGPADTAEGCLACICEAGCVGAFETCTGNALEVCMACSGSGCGFTPLDPALIMVIVG